MKLFYIILFCLSLFTNDKLDTCKGFEEYQFGRGKETYNDLTLEIDQGNSKLYTSKLTATKIANVQLEYVRITFTKDKLSDIELSTKNSTGIWFCKFLKDNYGNPTKIKNRLQWKGKHVLIIYELFDKSQDAVIDFYECVNT